MSRKDSLIQIENANVQKLTEALENILVRTVRLLDFINFVLFY